MRQLQSKIASIKHPFFRYYGGKYKKAPLYPKPIGNEIIEPFAGAAGYSTRYFGRNVWINDVDPIIYGLWCYLTRVSRNEILSIPIVDNVDSLPRKCNEEVKWLVGFWMNSGAVSPCKSVSAFGRARPETNAWSETIRDRIARNVESIRHWKVTNMSYEDLPNTRATWFVDPPYQGKAGRYYKHNRIDYNALSDWCLSRQGLLIACENVGADWLPFRPFLETVGTKRNREDGKSKAKISVEAIFTQDRR